MTQVTSQSFVLRNCFAQDPSTRVKPAPKQCESYLSEERTVDFIEGESRRVVTKMYPITPEYVRSFVEATDYKAGVACQMPKRENLGDVREAQDLAGRDTTDVRKMIAELRSKLDELEKKKDTPTVSTESVDAPKGEGDETNG